MSNVRSARVALSTTHAVQKYGMHYSLTAPQQEVAMTGSVYTAFGFLAGGASQVVVFTSSFSQESCAVAMFCPALPDFWRSFPAVQKTGRVFL
jgi:hypothetical protein